MNPDSLTPIHDQWDQRKVKLKMIPNGGNRLSVPPRFHWSLSASHLQPLHWEKEERRVLGIPGTKGKGEASGHGSDFISLWGYLGALISEYSARCGDDVMKSICRLWMLHEWCCLGTGRWVREGSPSRKVPLWYSVYSSNSSRAPGMHLPVLLLDFGCSGFGMSSEYRCHNSDAFTDDDYKRLSR